MIKPRMLVRFSCGESSAVAAKIATVHYVKDFSVEVIYANLLANEHPDNRRFLIDVERWIGQPINILQSKKYQTVSQVQLCDRFIASRFGAPCTKILKREVLDGYSKTEDTIVIGFTADEADRIAKFEKRYPEKDCEWVLADRGITKADCHRYIERAGIRQPEMYRLGYDHNNCIGCVKGGMGYWNKIRVDFPERFAEQARIEREIGNSILGRGKDRIYLDQLHPKAGRFNKDQPDECGLFCEGGKVDAQ